jgi:hypothetical protein
MRRREGTAMRACLWLTPPMVVLIALVSALGIFVDDVYARESP